MSRREETASGPAVEGYAIETTDGLVFTVKGVLQPPDRLIAYLRYLPDPSGERLRDGRRYRRMARFADQLEALEKRGEGYLAHDPMIGVVVQGAPRGDLSRVYDPVERLRALTASGPRDEVEERALELAELLRDASGVPRTSLGVTGSLLVRLHLPSSDIDLVVYGEQACRAVHGALGGLLDDPSNAVRRPQGEELAAIHAAHREETPLDPADFARLQASKVNEGRFAGRPFFVRFVKRPDEFAERYGDPRYRPAGRALVEARVAGAADALFTPCRYELREVSVLEASGTVPAGPGATDPGDAPARGAEPPDLREIVSFRGRFADQAREGDRVRAHGTLERVLPSAAPPYHRLVVGAAGDYLVREPD